MPTLADLSVIIPVAAGDHAWEDLISDLVNLPLEAEILFVSPVMPLNAPLLLAKSLARGRKVRWITSKPGRGVQLNAGARASTRKYLWFLHADSRLMKGSLRALEVSLSKHPDALHYFNLQFLDDGPSLMRVSAAGVWFRSNVLGIPFGDQGFCLSREKFERLGEFSESAAYGEDHLLIWKAKEQGIAIQSTRSILKTSARKYRRKGWGSTTLEHGCLTWRQGIPECLKLIRARILSRLKSLDR